MWQYMLNQGIEIQFAHQSFVWESEATPKAVVHCVIVGFANLPIGNEKKLFFNGQVRSVKHINAYLLDAPDIWITNRANIPPAGMEKMTTGSPPTVDGALTLSYEEKETLVIKYPI